MTKVNPIEKIVTHAKPHLDELCAIWLLLKFGEELFPGIAEAQIELVDSFEETYGHIDPATLEEQGVLCVGVGHGRLDEHLEEGGRQEGMCAAKLVAYVLGVDNDPALRQILNYVLQSDTEGGNETQFTMALMVKNLNDYQDAQTVIDWVSISLDAKYQQQQEFQVARQEVKEKGEKQTVKGFQNRLVTVYSIVSDNPLISQAARSLGADLIVQQKTTGNVAIFPNSRSRLKFAMIDIARLIRVAECRKNGFEPNIDWKELAGPGTVAGAEKWYFAQNNGDFLLNGSKSHHTDPTALSMEEIMSMVKVGLTPGVFEQSKKVDCKKGCCTHSSSNPCLFYAAGLHRCTRMRYKARQTA